MAILLETSGLKLKGINYDPRVEIEFQPLWLTILGLVIGTALVLASMFIEASAGGISMLKFWSASSMMIVLGGTVAATAVAFRLNEVTRVLGIIKFAFTKPKFQLQELVQALIDLAEINRTGPSELEKEIPNIKHAFIQDGVTFVTQGMKLDDMREILEQRESFRYKRELHESELMKTMGNKIKGKQKKRRKKVS
mgnify:CR=1 FL=1